MLKVSFSESDPKPTWAGPTRGQREIGALVCSSIAGPTVGIGRATPNAWSAPAYLIKAGPRRVIGSRPTP
jgi:hypothetical protein